MVTEIKYIRFEIMRVEIQMSRFSYILALAAIDCMIIVRVSTCSNQSPFLRICLLGRVSTW